MVVFKRVACLALVVLAIVTPALFAAGESIGSNILPVDDENTDCIYWSGYYHLDIVDGYGDTLKSVYMSVTDSNNNVYSAYASTSGPNGQGNGLWTCYSQVVPAGTRFWVYPIVYWTDTSGNVHSKNGNGQYCYTD